MNRDRRADGDVGDSGESSPEVVGAAGLRELGVVFIVALFVVIAVNIAMMLYLPRSTTNLGYWLIGKKWQMLIDLHPPVDWLILGDSSGNQGLMPRILEESLGGRAVNLCTIADMSVLNDAWMLDTYIEKKGRPRAVLLVHVYDVWHREFDTRMMARIPLRFEELRHLRPRVRLTPYKVARGLLDRYAPLYYQQESVAELIRFPFARRGTELIWDDDGFMYATGAKPETVEADARDHLKFVREKEFQLSESNRIALQYIVDMAEQYEFDLFIVNSPLYIGLMRDADFASYYSAMEQAIERVIGGRRNSHYILRTPATFAKEELQNADHVTSSAALDYTRRVVAEIQASR